jgi:CheY-like chemotaxis protein
MQSDSSRCTRLKPEFRAILPKGEKTGKISPCQSPEKAIDIGHAVCQILFITKRKETRYQIVPSSAGLIMKEEQDWLAARAFSGVKDQKQSFHAMKNEKIRVHKGSILLVEDDRVDVLTVKRAFRDIPIAQELRVVGNGEEALEYLRNSQNEKPYLILLDLNMPKMNGIELLQVIKSDDELKLIPVVILTSSKEKKDKLESYNRGVAGYVLKPVGYQEFIEVMKTIDHYWSLNELPD